VLSGLRSVEVSDDPHAQVQIEYGKSLNGTPNLRAIFSKPVSRPSLCDLAKASLHAGD
jgi:hypothetical protein